MTANEYHLTSKWRVLGTVDEVFGLVSRDEELARWWPAAFLDVMTLEPGDAKGLGKVVRMETRGWLPYRLHWHLRVDEMAAPHRFGFAVWGDFEGRGAWSFEPDGAWTDVGFEWQVRVQKPLVRYVSVLARPLFISNHRWAMARGEESLRLELTRRQATDPELRCELAPPPLAPSYGGVALGAAAGALVGLMLLRRR
ncbi:MAG: polyketide cyclase [Dehalococcoidia bacterium]|nr:polyketide cyclase [Dehalococcoidia bacterium]